MRSRRTNPGLTFLASLLGMAVSANVCLSAELATGDKPAEAFFLQNVLPIFEEHCFECHSHESGEANGGLMLDTLSGWSVGGDSGPAVVPRDPAKSLLVAALRYDQELTMPPYGKLPDELIAKIERWISDGAHDPRVNELLDSSRGTNFEVGRQHWAFQPRRRTVLPTVSDSTWPLSDIDRYVLARLEARNLRPVDDADRYTWLRRVTFDLTGVPPTPQEIHDFTADDSAEAYQRVVDRLLQSRAFGERWARHWLDLVGYADQIGTSNSVFAQHAWRFRDYVIDAYNSDKPFDRFIHEQIAGDLLPFETTAERADNLVATGFLVLGDIEIVEADKEKLLVDIVDQQLNKTGKAFLAMTIDCARCHDHKFDPISQRDYYALGGFFHNTSTVYKTGRGVWSDVHVVELPETAEQKAKRARREQGHAARLADLRSERRQAESHQASLDKQLENHQLNAQDRKQLTTERDRQAKLIKELNQQVMHAGFFAPSVPRAHGVRDDAAPGDMRITIRGNPRALGDQVPRGFLGVISPEPPTLSPGQSGRRELAQWIANPDHPLTARVAVNRIWQRLFGEGLVRSVDYFGLPGERPSHPELLDHLATRFVRDGWSRKKLIRALALSRTYRLAGSHDEHAASSDPDNRLLWRMNRFRLDAEAIRDAMIAVTGQLAPSQGGPAMPLEFPENVGGLDPKDVNPPHFRLIRWRREQAFERTIYLPIIRHAAQPGPATLRNTFDFPQPSQFKGRRTITAVPTQALFLMNSPEVKNLAIALAQRIAGESSGESERLERVWLRVLNRPITPAERREAAGFLAEVGEGAWTELCRALLASNEFLIRI